MKTDLRNEENKNSKSIPGERRVTKCAVYMATQ